MKRNYPQMNYLSGLKKPLILSFANPHLVAAAAEVVAVEADAAGTAAAAASENEFGVVETVVQLRKYALLDYWDIIAGLLQKMHSLALDQSVPSDAEFLLSVRHSRLLQNK
jgi:hypothetical protein